MGLEPLRPDDRSELALWRTAVEAWIAEADQPDVADGIWARLAADAARDGDLEFQWRATVARATLAGRRGDPDGAQALYRDALARFDQLAAAVTLDDRLDAFFALQQRATAAQVRTLLDAGRRSDAFDVARQYHRQLLQRVWTRHRSLPGQASYGALQDRYDALAAERSAAVANGAPGEALRALDAELTRLHLAMWAFLADASSAAVTVHRALRPGEVMLLFAPEERSREVSWLPMAASSTRVVLGRSYDHDSANGSRPTTLIHALEPLKEVLYGASQITLVVPAALDTLDLAAIDLGDGPLAWERDVVWSLDLPHRERAPEGGGTLLIGNPSADPVLTIDVAAHLDRLVAILPGSEQRREGAIEPAELDDLLRRQPLELLHYAGHAIHDGAPLDAGFLLHEQRRWTTRDALMLSRPPRVVTLAACEAAETGASSVGGLGLATAFVLGGSDVVVGSARSVESHVAFWFFERLHEGLARGTPPARAWRDALRGVAEAAPDEDWGLFRLVVPGG